MKNILKCIGWVVLNLLLQGVVQMLFSVGAMASGITDGNLIIEWIMNWLLVETIISNLLFVIVTVLICRSRKVKIVKEWRLGKADVKAYIMPCLISFTYSLFYNLITYDASTNATTPIHISAGYFGNGGILVLALALLISAPITEEIMCRGIMMNTLKRSFSAKTAIILSSVIFGMIHIMAGGIGLAVGAMVMGLVLAIIYEKTNSLRLAIVAHVVANLPDLILYSSPQINNVVRIGLAVAMFAVAGGCLWRWCKLRRTDKLID